MCAWSSASSYGHSESVSQSELHGTSMGISLTLILVMYYPMGEAWWSSSTYTGDFVRFPQSRNAVDLSEFRQKLRRAAKHLTVEEFVELRRRCDAMFDDILRGKGRRL